MAAWIVYMLRCADGTLYTGITTDLRARIEKHNGGMGAKYTRSRLPVICVWQKNVRSESTARKQEAAIKSLKRIEKEKLIAS